VPPAYRPPRPGSSGGARRQQRKRSKKKNKEGDGLWKLPQLWKSQRMLRDFFHDFHRCLEKPAGFSTITTGPAAIHQTNGIRKGDTSIEVNKVTFLKWLDNCWCKSCNPLPVPLHSPSSSPRLKLVPITRGGIPMRNNITSQPAMSCWSAAGGKLPSFLYCSRKH
jgi:hypothetical protein